MKKVYGSYLSSEQARQAVDELLSQGYTRDEIKVISNKDLGGELQYNENDGDNDERSLWEKIKDAFTFDEYDDEYWDRDLDNDERSLLESYKTNLQAGEVVVLVEEGADEFRDHFRDGAPDWDERENEFNEDLDEEGLEFAKPPSDAVVPPLNRDNLNEDEKVMELKKEKLNIDKQEVETGEVNVRKVVREETQTIEVPVEKEEIIIERRSVGEREVRDGEILDTDNFKEGEEIHIPIREEQVEVTKKTVVDDEVVIRRDKHMENETVTETVKHEDIEVDGDAEVEGDTIHKRTENIDEDPLI